MHLARPLTAVSVSFLLAASLAGCGSIVVDPSAGSSGGSSAGSSGDTPGGSDGTDTHDAKNASAELTPDNLGQRVVDAQTKAGTCHLTMTVEAVGTTISTESDIVVHDDTQDMHMVMQDPSGGGSLDLLFVAGDTYISVGEAAPGKYVFVDPDDGGPLADLASGMEAQSDPSASVASLDGAITSVTAIGEEKVDGVATTEYEVVVDTSKVSGASAEQVEGLGAAMPDELTYHYFLDADDLLRKVTLEIGGGSSTMEYSKYGEDLTVEAPDEADLVDASTLGV